MSHFFVLSFCVLALVGCGRKYSDPEAAFSGLTHLATLRLECCVVSMIEDGHGFMADRGLYRYDGSVLLALDLTKADFHCDGKTIRITLPDPEPLSPRIGNCDTYLEKRTLVVTETEFQKRRDKAESDAQDKIVEQAKDPDIARIAKNQASILIKNFYATHFPELGVIIK